MLRVTLTLLLMGAVFGCHVSPALPSDSPTDRPTAGQPTTKERIDAIAGAILPNNLVEGDPVEAVTLAHIMAKLNVPGVSVAVMRDGEIEWAQGFGVADTADGRAVTADTLFQAASISKPVAATASLSMVQDGLLGLDDNVNDKLTSWKVPDSEFTANNAVTLRRLLTHTAGLTVHGFPGYASTAKVPSAAGVLDGSGNTPAVQVDIYPGQSWSYSGGGYTVMQQLLCDVDKKEFPKIMRARVLEPAGMIHSTYEQPLPQARRAEAAAAHGADGSRIEGGFHTYPEMAAAGLWTTPSDLLRFARTVQRSRSGLPDSLLSPAIAAAMLEPGQNDWGLGPSIEGNGTRFGHGGANAGFRCSFTAAIDGEWGVAVMTNGDRGGEIAHRLTQTIAQHYGWPGPRPRMLKRVPLPKETLAQMAGKYSMREVGVIQVEATDNGLYADLPGMGRVELLPQSNTVAVVRTNGMEIVFELEGGAITGFSARGRTATKID